MNGVPMPARTHGSTPLDRARAKAFRRLLPVLFVCYVIAFVDRTNVSIAKLTMSQDLPGFTNAVIGFGAGLFFLGYFLLEIPGTLIIEKWSARLWISRIMVTWGLAAAVTAAVRTPSHFYAARFLLGLAEAGFFPGVIVYMTHWFPSRDRGRALALFMIATPVAQIISPKISNALLKIGTTEWIHDAAVTHPLVLGLHGWQWVYIGWGIPAVALGFAVLWLLTDRPRQARWLSPGEQEALEAELDREKRSVGEARRRLSLLQALHHPKVLLLSGAYFCVVTGSYGVEFFMPSILQKWYALRFDTLTWLVLLPPLLALLAQIVNGWNSDRAQERCFHTVLPIALGAAALALAPSTRGHLAATVGAFTLAYIGFKAYLPIFWTLPSLFLTETAAAGSIGLINSIGNLGGFLGPSLVGKIETVTGSFATGIYLLALSMTLAAILILLLGLGRRIPR